MILDVIAQYNPIYIQMHDNPDADAIGSGFGLYTYLKDELHKDCCLIYSGRNVISKPNLVYMLDMMQIPVTYVEGDTLPGIDTAENPMLVTVDCQYGARNVKRFECPNVAIIDHHQIEIEDVEHSLILPAYNACSTIVWQLLTKKGYEVTDDKFLASALYYGVFSDTIQLSELHNPVDYDAVEQLVFNNNIIKFLKNTNLSLDEMEIAASALSNYIYNAEYECAVIKTAKCDPNVLGLISDFLLQVDKVNTCVVFCDTGDGIKYSVRSCIKEVDASELASYLADNIGSGGGHLDKAGGFISGSLLEKQYPDMTGERYFSIKLHEYYESYDIIYAKDYTATLDTFKMYSKLPLMLGFVKMTDVAPVGTPLTCRTIEGDVDLTIDEDLIVMIGIKGEVYPTNVAKFSKTNRVIKDTYNFEECVFEPVYEPTVRNRITGKVYKLVDYAHTCQSTGGVIIYAKPIERGVKIFTAWTKDRYMRGNPGDYFGVRSDDLHDCYVIERDIFSKTYKEIGK